MAGYSSVINSLNNGSSAIDVALSAGQTKVIRCAHILLLSLWYANVFASFVPDEHRFYVNKINVLNGVRKGLSGRRQVLPGLSCRRNVIGALGADHQGQEGGAGCPDLMAGRNSSEKDGRLPGAEDLVGCGQGRRHGGDPVRP